MKHHRAIVTLHWLTALLVSTAFVIALVRTGIEEGESRRFWLDMHRSIGLLLLILVFVRAAARLVWGREPVNVLPRNLRLVSALSHVALYAVMLSLPLVGWAQSSARSQHFRLFGLPMPSLLAQDVELADVLGAWHERLAWSFLILIGLHAAAALWHHYMRGDGVLRSMLPVLRQENPGAD